MDCNGKFLEILESVKLGSSFGYFATYAEPGDGYARGPFDFVKLGLVNDRLGTDQVGMNLYLNLVGAKTDRRAGFRHQGEPALRNHLLIG